VSNAIENRYAYYANLIDDLLDEQAKVDAYDHLESWKLAREASVAIVGKALASYSAPGRNFVFRSAVEARETADIELAKVEAILGLSGACAYVDLSGGRWQ
jgi:hypothetical protein